MKISTKKLIKTVDKCKKNGQKTQTIIYETSWDGLNLNTVMSMQKTDIYEHVNDEIYDITVTQVLK